jgi:hypothetical protein
MCIPEKKNLQLNKTKKEKDTVSIGDRLYYSSKSAEKDKTGRTYEERELEQVQKVLALLVQKYLLTSTRVQLLSQRLLGLAVHLSPRAHQPPPQLCASPQEWRCMLYLFYLLYLLY